MGYRYRKDKTPDHMNDLNDLKDHAANVSPIRSDNTRVVSKPDTKNSTQIETKDFGRKFGLNLHNRENLDPFTGTLDEEATTVKVMKKKKP